MRNYLQPISFLIALICLGLTPVVGQERAQKPADRPPDNRTESDADLVAIRAAADAFVEAFNRADAKALANSWTEDGDYIDESGTVHRGRQAIEEGFTQFFADHPDAKMRITIDSLRLLNDSAAIEDGRGVIEPPTVGAPGTGKYTAVHVKVNGQWLLSTVRDHHVEIPSAYENLSDLEFLIGTWIGEAHGTKFESVCRWVANKSFVERSYTTTGADGAISKGVQLIGWNPQKNYIQSWNFSSDGGHAVGAWQPTDGGWSAEMHGIMGDGTPTTSTNLLVRLDENAYVWQSIQRSVGGASLPDTNEVVLKRQ